MSVRWRPLTCLSRGVALGEQTRVGRYVLVTDAGRLPPLALRSRLTRMLLEGSTATSRQRISVCSWGSAIVDQPSRVDQQHRLRSVLGTIKSAGEQCCRILIRRCCGCSGRCRSRRRPSLNEFLGITSPSSPHRRLRRWQQSGPSTAVLVPYGGDGRRPAVGSVASVTGRRDGRGCARTPEVGAPAFRGSRPLHTRQASRPAHTGRPLSAASVGQSGTRLDWCRAAAQLIRGRTE
jgi:hypothetical protein